MLQLADILTKAGLRSVDVNVILHSPRHGDLLEMMPGLVRTRRAALEAYQATHGSRAEAALRRGRPWLAAFVKDGLDRRAGRSRMLFCGLYKNRGARMRSHAEIMAEPEVRWLFDTFGAFGEFSEGREDRHHAWFDLVLSDHLAEFQGRLVCGVRLTQTYVRLAENLDAPVWAIVEHGFFDAAPPDWRRMRPRGTYVRELPPGWAARLREWRGIYLITDESDGARYVGSAYGQENLLGRWLTHVAGDKGVTRELKARNPVNFRFSILERVSPDMLEHEVIALEQTWMDRLHTRRYGLNA